MDFSSYPQTIAGMMQALQDLADDYSTHQHDGTSTRQFDTIRANGASLRALSIQKVGYGDTTAGLWSGVINGIPQFYLGNASNYIKFDGVNFSILGALSVSQIDIPDQTTADSFHVDNQGNSWWGSNVAGGIAAANAAITKAGAATFKNVSVGGNVIQYVITNSGIFSYGDGADGAATCDGSATVAGMTKSGSTYTMTRDVYFTTLAINDGITLVPNGYRIFCSTSLTVGQGASGTIDWNLITAAGYLAAPATPGAGVGGGANQSPSNGNDGQSLTNSLTGLAGGSGGNGGQSNGGSPPFAGGTGGAAGTATPANVRLTVGVQLATLLDVSSSGSTVKYTTSAGAGSGGSGAQKGNSGNTTGASGGGGKNGGFIAIYAKSIILNSGSFIKSNGENGGNGSAGSQSGGGGGGGGAGGVILLVYNTFTNNGTLQVNGGTGGLGNTTYGGAQNGTDGSPGSTGDIYEFQLSL